jgi:hypothetical protein
MNKWVISNLIGAEIYHDNVKSYPYGISLNLSNMYLNEVHKLRQWLYDQNIDAYEAKSAYAWYFTNESDRTAFILTWSD